ncbi:MAG: hypothetical protein MZU97_04945 [Bacillus subtilis]|nr:hypothetical protein [Bacillus subtilis]
MVQDLDRYLIDRVAPLFSNSFETTAIPGYAVLAVNVAPSDACSTGSFPIFFALDNVEVRANVRFKS